MTLFKTGVADEYIEVDFLPENSFDVLIMSVDEVD
jgi:hypothetical protein